MPPMRTFRATVQTPAGWQKETFEKAATLALVDMANLALDLARERIENEGISDTGEMAGSGDISETSTLHVKFGFYAPHALFVEEGTKARSKWPPKAPIERWARRKLGLSGQELARATYFIHKHIAEHGTEAQPYFEPAFKQASKQLPELVANRLS